MISLYLGIKAAWSWTLNALTFWNTKDYTRPSINSPEEAKNYWFTKTNNIYTGDPLRGALDFYTHPAVIQSYISKSDMIGLAKRSIDCDDVALWYQFVLTGLQGCTTRLVTIYDSSGSWGHHVILLWSYRGKQGVLDTNGYKELPDLADQTVCAYFNSVYKSLNYNYTKVYDTPVFWSI